MSDHDDPDDEVTTGDLCNVWVDYTEGANDVDLSMEVWDAGEAGSHQMTVTLSRWRALQVALDLIKYAVWPLR